MRLTLPLVALLLGLPAAATAADVAVTKTADAVEFKIGDELVTRYHVGPSVAKPYCWPLFAPGKVPVTRSWPMEKSPNDASTDHVHQKSLWFCHGDVIPEGVELKTKPKGIEGADFWAELPGHGRIVCTKVGEPVVTKDGGSVTTVNEWVSPDGVKVLDETRTLSLRLLPGGGRLLVFDIELVAPLPVTFGDTKEGAMGVRVNDSMRESLGKSPGKGVLTNAAGTKGEKAVWGYVSPWCDYSGPVGDATVGVAIFDGPANPYPAGWHSRGYGLMAANPFGRAKSGFPSQKGKTDLVKLAKGEHLKLRYGVYVHAGDVAEGKVAEAYEAFKGLK
jgi:hypothetical protein